MAGFFSSLIGSMAGSFGSGIGSHFANKVFGESLADRQKYALEQMAKQQEYNVENYQMQRDDQLRFTDPSFIRQRLERAGLSPSLALSNGASSPGMSTSFGSSSTAGGLSGSPLAHGTNILETMARIRNLDADTDNKTTDADYKKQTLLSRVDMLKDSALSAKYKAEMDRVDSLFRESMNQANYDQIRAVIDKMSEDIANNKNLTEIQRQKMNAYVDSVAGQLSLWDSEIGLNQAKQVTEGTQQGLNVAKTATEETKQMLNRANASLSSVSKSEVLERIKNYSSQRDKINAEIERIGKENNLTDQHIREIKNNIALRWATFGVNTAKDISSEVRNWINPFSALKKLKEENRGLQDMLDDKDIFFAN